MVREIFAGVALSATGLLLYAYYTIYFIELEACPLCVTQQLFFFLIAVCGYVAWFFKQRKSVFIFFSISILLFSIAGGAIAVRQLWLQQLPAELVPACGASLEFMLEVFPFSEVLKAMTLGDGNCAEVPWEFLGLSMAGWSLVWFLAYFSASSYLVNRNLIVKNEVAN